MDGQTRIQMILSKDRGLIDQTFILNNLKKSKHLISFKNTSGRSDIWRIKNIYGWECLTKPN